MVRSRDGADSCFTVSTGHSAARAVRSATEPSTRCFKPVRPRLPMTIKSALARFAAREIAKLGVSSSASVVQVSPFAATSALIRSRRWFALRRNSSQ